MQKMRSRAKTLFGCTASGQVEVEFLGTTSFSSTSTSGSAKSAPPALNTSRSIRSGASRSFLDLNDSFLDLNHDDNPSHKIRPGGGRRAYATLPTRQAHSRTSSISTSVPTLAVAESPVDPRTPKPKIITGGTRRHIVLSQQQSESASDSIETEGSEMDTVPPLLRINTTSQPSSPVSSSSSSPPSRTQAEHTVLIPVPTRHTRAPSAPVAITEASPSPISQSPQVPIDTTKDLPPLPPPSPPPLFPTSSRRPSRTLPSPPSSHPAPVRSTSAQVSTATRRRLPSLPCLPFVSPSTPPPPFPLPVPPSQFLVPRHNELGLAHSSSSLTLRTRHSFMSDAETLPPYTIESPLSLTVT